MSDDDDREGDPFENLDPPADREGDPFEELDPPADDDGEEPPGPADRALDPSDVVDRQPAPDDDPLVESDAAETGQTDPFTDEGETPTDGPGGEPFTETTDPFADVGDRGDPFEGEQSAFERVDVGEVDADQVWAEITEEGETGTPSPQESRYADVSKHRFCEQCPHFSGPPAVRCGNEGTEIVEFVDMETVRLLNCPIVAEQRELEEDG